VIGSMMDITQRKEAERMKSDFVSFVSHQLRTPLAGMNWMLELAADTEGVPDEARANIADARESAARLVTLVNDLLDIARLESGRIATEPETLALRSLTQSVVAEMQTLVDERRHALEVHCDASLPDIFADAQLLRQVVGNLLSNAIKYTPPGGRIVVTISRHNGSVTWAVKDTGVGIPRAAQARLFEKFYRAENAVSLDSEGTGLGLHLVRLIVEQAGGRVWCESEEGRGATFAFTLPAMSSVEGVRL
jgi:signal transduction histidine kinase